MVAFRAWDKYTGKRFADLAAVRQPTLVVNGIHDEMIPIANSYWLLENLPNAMLIVCRDSGAGLVVPIPRVVRTTGEGVLSFEFTPRSLLNRCPNGRDPKANRVAHFSVHVYDAAVLAITCAATSRPSRPASFSCLQCLCCPCVFPFFSLEVRKGPDVASWVLPGSR